MKRMRMLSILLLLSILCSLVSCSGERYKGKVVIDDAQGLTFSARGSDKRIKQVTVKRGEELLFSEKVKVDRKVGTLGGSYGFQVLDLNFDGRSDMMLVDKVAGEEMRYICWIAGEDGSYTRHPELTGLCNVAVDEKLKMVMSYRHSYEVTEGGDGRPDSTVTTDTVTRYIWENGELVPFRRVSLTYYSETERYCYSVSDYDTVRKEFPDPDDVWLTPAEYEKEDFSFLFYFR